MYGDQENLYVDIGPERVKLEHGTGYLTVPDPDLEIREGGGGGQSSRPLEKGRGRFWSKNKGGPGAPGPLSWIRHCLKFCKIVAIMPVQTVTLFLIK